MTLELHTERLRLRRFTQSDAENLVILDADPEVMRFLTGGTPTPRAVIVNEILPRFLDASACTAGFGYWAAIERATSAFLGWFALRPRDGDTPVEAHLGYRLRRDAWGQGYATEGTRALIAKGFDELGVHRVLATTYQDNHASRRVLEKAGLTLVRSFRFTTADLLAAGTFQVASAEIWDGEELEYALEKADWGRQHHAPP